MECIPIRFGKNQDGVEIVMDAAGVVASHCELMETQDPPSPSTRHFFNECLRLYRIFGGTKYLGKRGYQLLVVDKFRENHRQKFGRFFLRRRARQEAIVKLWEEVNRAGVNPEGTESLGDQLVPAIDALVILALDHGLYERGLIRRQPDGQWIFTKKGASEITAICARINSGLGGDEKFLVFPGEKANAFGFCEPVQVHIRND